MKNWWEERYVLKRDWILDNLSELSISSDETMILLLIDFMNEHGIAINHAVLADKVKKSSDEIDQILSKLTAKGYLNLAFKDGHILFAIDGVFHSDEKQTMRFDESLFELFETEFARPLAQMELQRMAEWLTLYDQKLISYALREALTYDHKSFDYIERILIEWKRRELSAEDYEEGKR